MTRITNLFLNLFLKSRIRAGWPKRGVAENKFVETATENAEKKATVKSIDRFYEEKAISPRPIGFIHRLLGDESLFTILVADWSDKTNAIRNSNRHKNNIG